ncbi:MAG TPA: HD domain-containing phosphohydrolase [Gammaproteobacteria bacterium]
MRKRVDVSDLELGMFVAELDRPWLDSPFLFQGFIIEGEEELATLQEICDFVYVDTERSLPKAAPGSGGPRRAVANAVAPEHVPARLRPVADAVRSNDPRVFARDFQTVINLQKRAHLALIRLIDQRRLGRMVQAGPVLEVVRDLTESILANPNTALWLTKLREQDEFSAMHSINVAILSIAFGRHLQMPVEMLHAIGLGAMLHDIGLNEPSNDIIRSKVRLNAEDFAVVRRHPLDGMYSLKRLNELPGITRDIIRWHHERIDGSGYPHGLKNGEIPRHVLIAGIADAYDAMTSDRAWRRAMQPPDALAELHKDADRSFGSELVQSFIHCIGIYPVGTVVKLNTGAIGMVASTFPGVRLTPLVLLLKDSMGTHMNPRRLVNLAALRDRQNDSWSIVGAIEPSSHGININSIATDELRAFG